MALHLDLSPFLAQFSGFVDQKSTAFDTHEFAAIKNLFVDNIELLAELLIGVG